MGLDPGIGITGWAMIRYRKDQPQIIDFGSIHTSPDKPTQERLLDLFQDLLTLIKKHHPNYLAVEKLFFNTNAKTAIIVGEARGVILLAGALSKLKILEFTPLQIKLSIVGYGVAKKFQVQKMVQKLFHLTDLPKPDDAADALAVALTCGFYLDNKINQIP
jgi:crossover junction endodeoxyribonuclease RuvC